MEARVVPDSKAHSWLALTCLLRLGRRGLQGFFFMGAYVGLPSIAPEKMRNKNSQEIELASGLTLPNNGTRFRFYCDIQEANVRQVGLACQRT